MSVKNPTKAEELEERVARILCSERGGDPDQPITFGLVGGGSEYHEVGWTAYVPLAAKVIAEVQKGE